MPPPALETSLALDPPSVRPAGAVVLTLRAWNRGTMPVRLTFPSAQRYDFTLEDAAGQLRWRWSDGRVFAQLVSEATVAPGAALVYSERFAGGLAPGPYRVRGIIAALPGDLATVADLQVADG